MPSSRGHNGDGGVSARMEGTFLTMMNDTVEPVFWVFTANDVRKMHEAFFRAERVDAVFYVPLPGPEERAALWRLYIRKFFPETVKLGKQKVPYPRHISLDGDRLLEEMKAAKKIDTEAWTTKFTAVLMATAPGRRERLLEKIAKCGHKDAAVVVAGIKAIDDDGWSPAEIRACCRLSRRLREPLTKTQKRIRPVSLGSPRVLEALEEWAAESALDANTGETYTPATAVDEDGNSVPADGRQKKTSKTKVRRRVRKMD